MADRPVRDDALNAEVLDDELGRRAAPRPDPEVR
jgi:hypothetical protein